MKHDNWVERCNHWKSIWPLIQEKDLKNDANLGIYSVLHGINTFSLPQHSIVGDAGSISYAGPVVLEPKKNQRLIFSPAQADMGWAIPAGIGVALASKAPVIVVTGDGSSMSNIQELATIRYNSLNIKIIILNNAGYLSIKNTQNNYFDGRVYGALTGQGFWIPDFKKVAISYELKYTKLKNVEDLGKFEQIFNEEGPVIVDCVCNTEEAIVPYQAIKNGKQAGPHDMAPFLPPKELKEEMVVEIPIKN
ncbi:MAG: hypothetical protein CMF69_12320 [Magnetovibrio sp.]|nr:hypothetical protein [Magnetovibrio sp.]